MTDNSGKLACWRLRLVEFELDAVHRAGVKHQAADAVSRLPTTGIDDTPLHDDVQVLKLPGNTRSDDRSSVLMITNAKQGWHTKRVSADETDIFTLRWGDTGNTDRTGYKHTPALPEGLRVANSPDLGRPVPTTDSATNQGNDTYCNQIASVVGKPNSLYLYDRNGILVRQSKIEGAVQKVSRTCRASFSHFVSVALSRVTQDIDFYTPRYVTSPIGPMKPLKFIRPYRTADCVLHKALGTMLNRNYDCFLAGSGKTH